MRCYLEMLPGDATWRCYLEDFNLLSSTCCKMEAAIVDDDSYYTGGACYYVKAVGDDQE